MRQTELISNQESAVLEQFLKLHFARKARVYHWRNVMLNHPKRIILLVYRFGIFFV